MWYYSTYPNCAEHCSVFALGDGVCDPECLVEECFNDLGDCANIFCDREYKCKRD
jgi:hypothetical protein